MEYIAFITVFITVLAFYFIFHDLNNEYKWNKMHVGNSIQIRTEEYPYEKYISKKIIGKTESFIKIQHFGVFNKSEFLTKLKYDNYHKIYYLKMK